MNTMNSPTLARASIRQLYAILQILFWGGILIYAVLMAVDIWYIFKPANQFSAERGIAHWSFSVTLSPTLSRSVIVPFVQFQPINPETFSSKAAYLVTNITVITLGFATYLYSIRQISHIIKSLKQGISPFRYENVVYLKRLGIAIILYSLFSKLLLNVLYILIVDIPFAINLSGISLQGIFIGILVLIIAEVFKHGVYLQEEHDTTL